MPYQRVLTSGKGFYTNLNMPLQPFIDAEEKQNLKYLIKGKRDENNFIYFNKKKATKAWQKIANEIIDVFGVSQEYDTWFRAYTSYKQMECKYLKNKLQIEKQLNKYTRLKDQKNIKRFKKMLSDNEIWSHRMDAEKAKLDKIKKPEKKQNYAEIIAAIDHNIDTWKMTLKVFLATIKRKQKEVKEIEKKNRKNKR